MPGNICGGSSKGETVGTVGSYLAEGRHGVDLDKIRRVAEECLYRLLISS